MKPVADYLKSLGTLAINSEVTEEPSFLTAYNKYLGNSSFTASRIIDSDQSDPSPQ